MLALISHPDAPAAAAGDSILQDDMELMALDRTTGLYNYYVFRPAPPATNGARALHGTVERVVLEADGTVTERQKRPGEKAIQRVADSPRCFACHVLGAPVMNELSDGWDDWISPRKTRAVSVPLSGTTSELVGESTGDNPTGRSSFAGSLEVTVRDALRALGAGASTGSGLVSWLAASPWGRGVLDNALFCQSTVQVLSAEEAVPLEVYIDPWTVRNTRIVRPIRTPGTERAPLRFPVRAQLDVALEEALVARGVLSPEAALALRLVDPVHDVFSAVRCGAKAHLDGSLDASLATLDGRVRAAVEMALTTEAAARPEHSAAHAYARALLSRAPDLDARKEAYLQWAEQRLVGAGAPDAAARQAIEQERARRWREAEALYPEARNPFGPLPLGGPARAMVGTGGAALGSGIGASLGGASSD
jgi:hypothetical protein